jgi:hypothetical protein
LRSDAALAEGIGRIPSHLSRTGMARGGKVKHLQCHFISGNSYIGAKCLHEERAGCECGEKRVSDYSLRRYLV